MASKEGNVVTDIESGDVPLEIGNSFSIFSEGNPLTRACSGFSKFDGLRGEGSEETSSFVPKSGDLTCGNVQVVVDRNSGVEYRDLLAFPDKGYSNEKHPKPYSNKHSKPPRPPKGPLLNASDMKLVMEMSELAAKKRVRIERMRALKKMKAAKGSSSSGNITAMVITVLFFIVIILQGLCCRGGVLAGFRGSTEPSAANKGLISMHFYSKPPANEMNGLMYRYPNSGEPASESGPQAEEGRDVQ